MTREDVIMLEILEAKLAREGREQGLKEGLEAGREQGLEQGREEGLEERLQLRITYIEGMLNQGIPWETIGVITRVDEAGLHQLREELDRLQGTNGSEVD